MSWIDTIWSLNAATCLVLGFVYALIWLQRREKVETGIFAILALSTFGYSAIELMVLRTADPVHFGTLLRWAQIPFFFALIALVALVRIYLRAGRQWLAWVVVAGRAVTIVLTFFVFSPSIQFREITAMRPTPFLGETVYAPVGVANPWQLIPHIGLLLLVIFATDAAISVWRRRDPLRVRLLSLAISAFLISLLVLAIMFFWLHLPIPLMPSIFFLGIVLVMGFELSLEILQAARLAGELRRSKEELVEAQRLAKVGSWIWDVETDDIAWSEELYNRWSIDPSTPRPKLASHQPFYTPESWDLMQTTINEIVKTGNSHEIEIEMVRQNGEAAWSILRCEAISDASGKVIKVRGTSQDITLEKLAEKSLQMSEERFVKAFNASPAPISIYRQRDRTLLEINEQWTKVFGYSRDEGIGREAESLGLIDDQHALTEIGKAMAEMRAVRDLEVKFKTKSGEIRQISLSTEQIEVDGDACSIFFHNDITDQKRAEEEKQKLIYDLGERVKELKALHLAARILQDESKGVVETLQAIVELLPSAWQFPEITAGRVRYGEIEVTTTNFTSTQWSQSAEFTAAEKQGSIEVVYLEKRPGRDIGPFLSEEQDLINSLAEMVRAALHRRYAEIELRKSEERYRDLVENALDIIYTHDLEGNYTSINKAGERITGYTMEEVLKMNLTDTVAPDFLDQARKMMVNKLAGETETVYDLEILAKDGHTIAVEVNTRLVMQDGVPVGIQGIARDVTERRQLEDRLRQSQKLEGIGQMAGGIAHDFNNLLTAINGYADLALRKIPTGDPLRQNIEEIRKAGDRAADLTGQLLAFSRRQVLSPKVHNVNTVIEDVEKMLKRLIKADVELKTRLDSDLGNIKADPGQIGQVIVNLALNARDAMPDGGTVTIETQNIDIVEGFADPNLPSTPGGYVKIAVSDTGTGMDDDVQQHIFEPFFTTKEVGKGTGLGLAMVYGIITQSGGSIKVYSEVGHGSTFKIYLPRVDEAAPEVTRREQNDEELSGTETILLVEDDPVVRDLVREILTGNGYKVLEAVNGEAALSICETYLDPIHVLLTDVIMPGLSGPAVKKQIVELFPNIKVLFMSGYTDEAIATSGVLSDGATFIEKPFTPDALTRKVREVLES